jgi:hypothetical protein
MKSASGCRVSRAPHRSACPAPRASSPRAVASPTTRPRAAPPGRPAPRTPRGRGRRAGRRRSRTTAPARLPGSRPPRPARRAASRRARPRSGARRRHRGTTGAAPRAPARRRARTPRRPRARAGRRRRRASPEASRAAPRRPCLGAHGAEEPGGAGEAADLRGRSACEASWRGVRDLPGGAWIDGGDRPEALGRGAAARRSTVMENVDSRPHPTSLRLPGAHRAARASPGLSRRRVDVLTRAPDDREPLVREHARGRSHGSAQVAAKAPDRRAAAGRGEQAWPPASRAPPGPDGRAGDARDGSGDRGAHDGARRERRGPAAPPVARGFVLAPGDRTEPRVF